MLGAVLSLCAAFFWAASVILFKISGETFSPISLNIFKSLIALVLVTLTMMILNIDFLPEAGRGNLTSHLFWLSVSGVIGITLADLFFFIALNRLGAGLTAIVECLYLPCVIFFSFLLLKENLSVAAIAGGSLVFTAVLVGAIPGKKERHSKQKKDIPWFGIFMGCLSMVCIAIGIVIIKDLLAETNVLWATLIRVTAGVISLFALAACHPGRRSFLLELKFSRAWAYAVPASIFGNYLALLCWIGGMKYTTASKAAIFNQMSTIFIFILAAIFLKEKITRNRLAAICLALTGAGLTLLG